jgi:hypothetical protein
MVKDECVNISLLKEKYEKFKKEHSLPEFDLLNRLFDIEEIDVETDFLLRKIRRIISDRIAGYLRFIEIILNPSNAPMFFFKLIKKLEHKDKETLAELHEKLGNFELEIVSLDLNYEETREAGFIKRTTEIFEKNVSVSLLEIVDKLGNGDSHKKINNNRNYFG